MFEIGCLRMVTRPKDLLAQDVPPTTSFDWFPVLACSSLEELGKVRPSWHLYWHWLVSCDLLWIIGRGKLGKFMELLESIT